MKGSIGSNCGTVITPCSHSFAAMKRRQRKLKAEGPAWINPMAQGSEKFHGALRAVAIASRMSRENPEEEIWHTLKTSAGEVKRHQVMSRHKANKLNQFNEMNGIALRWVMGGRPS